MTSGHPAPCLFLTSAAAPTVITLIAAGETLTFGDIPAGAQLYRFFTLEIDRPSLPSLEEWYKRLQEREAYRTHVMVPFDDLKGR